MIRRAERGDVEDLREMAESFSEAVGFEKTFGVAFNVESFTRFVEEALEKERFIVLIDDEKRGFLAGVLGPVLPDPSKSIASELAWWVNPEARGGKVALELLKEFVVAAMERGAVLVSMGCIDSLDGERVGKIYKRMGFQKTEQNFIMRL